MAVDPPIHVLLVQNEPVDVGMVRVVLDTLRLEYKLAIVLNADQAIALLNRDPPFEDAAHPDLVVLGLLLPDIGGVAVLEEVERLRKSSKRNIIAMVALRADDEKSRKAAKFLGADAYFIKPTRSDEVQAIVLKLRQMWQRFRQGASLEPKTPHAREKF